MSKKRKNPVPGHTRKEVKDAVHEMVMKQSERLLREMQESAVDEVVYKFSLVMCWYMRKEYGWGRRRIIKLLQGCTNDFEAIIGKYVTFEDIAEQLYEETGVDMRTRTAAGELQGWKYKEDGQ